jgi:hypothetical protein
MTGYVKDIVYKTSVTPLDELKLRIVIATELHGKHWRTLEGKLNIAWASEMLQKAFFVKLFSIL